MGNTKVELSRGTQYLFRHMEKIELQNEQARQEKALAKKEMDFAQVERFFRQIKTQNIFIFTVGLNGKPESTILSKAIFSMNRVVKVYYSTSFDESKSGYLRILPDSAQQTILVERVHGYRGEPEFLYRSTDECHIIRWMIKWMLPRFDWSKTKLVNLDLYRMFIDQRERVLQKKLEESFENAEAHHK
ncbi:hypothetical protein THMIRHAS_21940 [Thiosulfatimonas sediminis]|uniref:Uncharacterized protein n=1 Tax=Thiosulfatimonas sediminis TaxID=2675054 RepID=A0A6F8PXG6_9GAMM|nr:hypothetical protein [Thiosulfatimonas sediminis]BBP46821.1 hypothetical protein THMIRHAS_21940 [Thiosulfatimonas sediminis]